MFFQLPKVEDWVVNEVVFAVDLIVEAMVVVHVDVVNFRNGDALGMNADWRL